MQGLSDQDALLAKLDVMLKARDERLVTDITDRVLKEVKETVSGL